MSEKAKWREGCSLEVFQPFKLSLLENREVKTETLCLRCPVAGCVVVTEMETRNDEADYPQVQALYYQNPDDCKAGRLL